MVRGSVSIMARSLRMARADGVYHIATGCPITSLTGPAGVSGRLAEAVGTAANAVMGACGN